MNNFSKYLQVDHCVTCFRNRSNQCLPEGPQRIIFTMIRCKKSFCQLIKFSQPVNRRALISCKFFSPVLCEINNQLQLFKPVTVGPFHLAVRCYTFIELLLRCRHCITHKHSLKTKMPAIGIYFRQTKFGAHVCIERPADATFLNPLVQTAQVSSFELKLATHCGYLQQSKYLR